VSLIISDYFKFTYLQQRPGRTNG